MDTQKKKKQASKKYSSTSYTIAHPEPPKHTVLPACFSCKIFCWLMLASLSVNVHSFKTLYYKHEHKMAPKSVRLKLPVTLNPRKCSEVCVSTGMCVAVMRVLCRASSVSFTAWQQTSQKPKNHAPKSHFITTELPSFLLALKTGWRLGEGREGRVRCAWWGLVQCLCEAVP